MTPNGETIPYNNAPEDRKDIQKELVNRVLKMTLGEQKELIEMMQRYLSSN